MRMTVQSEQLAIGGITEITVEPRYGAATIAAPVQHTTDQTTTNTTINAMGGCDGGLRDQQGTRGRIGTAR